MDDGFIPALRFHALTRFYDPVVRVTTRETRIKRELVGGLGAANRVLDLGSGTGTLLAMIRVRYPDAELAGLDRDPKVIALARQKLGPDVRLEQGDATCPPFGDACFDHVVSSLFFHHLKRSQKLDALRAARRVLSRDGQLHLALRKNVRIKRCRGRDSADLAERASLGQNDVSPTCR